MAFTTGAGQYPGSEPVLLGKTPVEVVRMLLKPKNAKIWDA